MSTPKATRDSLRSRKIVMKGQERSKHVRAATNAVGKGALKRNGGMAALLDDQEDFTVPGLVVQRNKKPVRQNDVDELLPGGSSSGSDTDGTARSLPTEVPLLTMIRSPHPWDGVGADFELISNPGDRDVIALEEEDFDGDFEDDDDWENVVDEDKVLAAKKSSYATALKSGLKH